MLRLRKFMFERVYLGPEARSEHQRVQRTLRGLFDTTSSSRTGSGADEGDDGEVQAVTDYVAGMTDRYAIATFDDLRCPRSRSC